MHVLLGMVSILQLSRELRTVFDQRSITCAEGTTQGVELSLRSRELVTQLTVCSRHGLVSRVSIQGTFLGHTSSDLCLVLRLASGISLGSIPLTVVLQLPHVLLMM